MKKLILLAIFLIPSLTFAGFETNMKYGMSGGEVSALQDLLVAEGCLTVSPTGYFGLLTLEGVKCFQAKYNISPVSGYFGVLSRTQANSILANALTTSDEAEQEETGNTVTLTACNQGQLFNILTGQPCNESAKAISDTSDDVQELKNTIRDLETKIDRIKENTEPNLGAIEPVVPTPEPLIASVDVQVPSEVDLSKLDGSNIHDEFPIIFSGNWESAIFIMKNPNGDKIAQYPVYERNEHFAGAWKPGSEYTWTLTYSRGNETKTLTGSFTTPNI